VLVDEERSIIVGQPIVDAYLVEGAQEWIGGAFHSSFPREWTAYETTHPVPTKPSSIDFLDRALDWITPTYAGTPSEKDRALDAFRRALVAGAESAQKESVRLKYQNAITFLDSRRNEIEMSLLR
jgi:hypothetical protein